MATTAAPVSRRALQARSIAEAFRITAEDFPDRVAVRTKDDGVSITWGELRDRVDALAGGLAKLGVKRGDTVALMLSNRPEFHLADLAVMSLGAVPYSIYLTSAPEQVAYVVGDAGSSVAIVEEAFLGVLPELETVIVLEGARGEGTLAWEDVEGSNPDFDVESAWRAVGPEDLLTLIYTSGTTGPPKGVQLVHRNLMAATEAIESMIQFPDGAKVISWLPSAHIAERAAHHYLPIVYAMTITCCDNPREVVSYLPLVKPTWFFAVPRIWEKLKSGLETMLASQPEEQRAPAAGRARRGDQEGRARAGGRAGAGGARRRRREGRRGDVLRPARDARPRRDRGGQRRRRADAARGARLLPRDRDRARGAVGDVRDVWLWVLQSARKGPHRDSRAARARRRDQARRGR